MLASPFHHLAVDTRILSLQVPLLLTPTNATCLLKPRLGDPQLMTNQPDKDPG